MAKEQTPTERDYVNATTVSTHTIPVQQESTDLDPFIRASEVYLSSEILERAPTKDRPDLTYATTTKVTLTFDANDQAFTEETIGLKIKALHGIIENALQEEIMRRKVARSEDEAPF